MNPAPMGSFLRFVFGFSLFISLSLGLTYAVNKYASAKDFQQVQSAAAAKLLGK